MSNCELLIHIVDPPEEYYDKNKKRWKAIVEKMFMKSLIIAEKFKMRSIAIPILDLGHIFSYYL